MTVGKTGKLDGAVRSGTNLKKTREQPPNLRDLSSFLKTGRRESFALRNPDRLTHLTPREREIVRWIVNGDSNKEVGNRLNIAERTVKSHLTVIFRKFGVSGRLQLALFILRKIARSQ